MKLALSPGAKSALEALRSLGGEARTAQIAAKADRMKFGTLVTRLETLERNGLVTSSLTLDRLERIWTVNGGPAA